MDKMFQPEGLGLTIFGDRYARHEEETWVEGARRVADHVAAAEDNGKVKLYSDRFYNEIASGYFFPGGRIMYGAGRPKAQLLNCFVIPTADSREGWARATSDVIIISSLMGGVGANLSPIRPRGSIIKGTGGVATGAVSLMRLINGVGNEIVGGGGRRMALMLCLDATHPDLPEFLDAKLDRKELNNANISVILNFDPEIFIEKVVKGEDLEFSFNGVPTPNRVEEHGELVETWTINARDLWMRIVENAWQNGEPGVLNSYLANKMNNIWYHKPLISTNPCGEIWLEEYGCCDLGSLVLPQFVDDGKFNWDKLDETIRLGVRFLDDVLTINHYPLPEIKENCETTRRIGLGVMGLHTMLMSLGMKYDSSEAFDFVDKLFSVIKNTAYDASINLAIEKGPFPAYDQRFLDSGFSKTLKRGIRNKIKEHGIRNCALLTIPPTGTTSIVAGVSSGIEPIPAPIHWRTYFDNTSDGQRQLRKELVVDKSYLLYPDVVQGAADIPVRAHFEMQRVVQKHIDNAVSKTINLPNDYPIDELADLWLEYISSMKGSTFYRWGSRENEPITPVPREEWAEVLASQNGNTVYDFDVEAILAIDCPGGVCEVPQQ
jgi:ribonucleoside-diphosphate reductase alpha chain